MDLDKATQKGKKWLLRIAIVGAILAVVGPVLYTTATLNYAYSKGVRVGFVQKLSKRGWVCKTNEGELSMVNMPGQVAQIFDFTVPDDAVAKQIESFGGHRVELTYEEHRGVPSKCFGDTPYFVVAVKKLD
jgi:hypothetical protein